MFSDENRRLIGVHLKHVFPVLRGVIESLLIVGAKGCGAVLQRIQTEFSKLRRILEVCLTDKNFTPGSVKRLIHRLQLKRASALSNKPGAEPSSGVYTFQAKTRSPQVQAAAPPKGRTGVAVVVIGV